MYKIYVIFIYVFLFNSCRIDKSEAKIILLSDDTISVNSLDELYATKRLIYRQYEGYMLFTSDLFFGNPILMPENSNEKINSDILSQNEIIYLLKNKIEKVVYKIKLDSLKSLDLIKKSLDRKNTNCTIINNSNVIEYYYRKNLICKIIKFNNKKFINIEIYPVVADVSSVTNK